MGYLVSQLEAFSVESHAASWRALGGSLRQLGYSSQAICVRLGHAGPDEELLANRGRLSGSIRRELITSRDSLDVAILMFFASASVTPTQYRALPSALRESLQRLELVRSNAHTTTANGVICELHSRLLVSDKHFEYDLEGHCERHFPEAGEPCVAINRSSLELYRAVASVRPTGDLLDVGCGNGCLGLFLHPGHRRVRGIDINPRAVCYARINCMLNQMNAQFERADCFAMGAGERYSHVIFNSNVPIGFRFMEETLASLLEPGGRADIWLLFFLTRQAPSVEELLRVKAPRASDAFAVQVNVTPDSPLALSADVLRTGELPRDYPLIENPGMLPTPPKRDGFLADLRSRGVIEVRSAVVTLR